MQKTITIALDMMSGDHGLESSVPAALKSLSKHQELNLILVGDKDKISKILKDSDIKKYSDRLRINHTDEFIRMDDEVLNAIRYKKKIFYEIIDKFGKRYNSACLCKCWEYWSANGIIQDYFKDHGRD